MPAFITESTPLMDATLLANELPPAADGAAVSSADDVAMLSDASALDLEQFSFTRCAAPVENGLSQLRSHELLAGHDRSFGFMTSRRLQRRYRGVYKKVWTGPGSHCTGCC